MKNYTYEWIKSTFIELTKNTYPYGHEDEVAQLISDKFKLNLEKDTHGNYYVKIGESRTMFTSHFDTANKNFCSVNHTFDGDLIKTDGKSILGADDKAGVTIMMYMIQNQIPGLYYFFCGEEVGCVGSSLLAKFGDVKGKYDKVISFDRRGTTSVITHQSRQRTSSDKFAEALSKELNKFGLSYEKDDTGVYTDSAEFSEIVPECTNISVGYYSEHTFNERQDILHLSNLADACLLVDWESLPVVRDPKVSDYKKYDYGNYTYSRGRNYYSKRFSDKYYCLGDDDDEDKYYEQKWYPKKEKKSKKSKSYYDSCGDLVDLDSNRSVVVKKTGKYESFKSKFLYTAVTNDELEIVKKQASEFMS